MLDASTLIEASQKYYSFDRVDEYWSWLVHVGKRDCVKIPDEIYMEIVAKDDKLKKWAAHADTRRAPLLEEETDSSPLSHVRECGYGKNLTESAIGAIGGDQYLIAYALKNTEDRKVVTTEQSKKRAKRQHSKVPDVCDGLDVTWCNQFDFIQELDFSTRWEERLSPEPLGPGQIL